MFRVRSYIITSIIWINYAA